MMTVNEAIAKAEQWRKEGACGPAGLVAIALLDELEIARATMTKHEQEIIALHAKLAGETLRADQGWQRYEAANNARINADALLSKAIPEGYVAVPKEPTSREMNKYELFSEDEFIALVRMNECFMDGEGYDVEPEMVDKLIEIGLIYRPRRNLCALTDYGSAVLKAKGKK